MDLDSPAFIDQVSKALLESDYLYDTVTNNQWFFDNAKLISLNEFLTHLPVERWRSFGFTARPYGDSGEWEILCPEIIHKTRVTTEYLTNFVVHLPKGTKINIGGFKNV